MPKAMSPLERAEKFQLDVSASAWYDLWHTHVDWEGNESSSPEARTSYLQALFKMFDKALAQTHCWERPSNVWILFVPDNSEDDALYVHTPNPNKNSPFPYPFEGVSWGAAPPVEVKPYIKPAYEVGVSNYNGTMFWIRERNAT